MIKTLQKKFVVSSMIAISVLIMILLGAINIANIFLVENETKRTMDMLYENEGGAGTAPNMSEKAPSDRPFDFGYRDKFMSASFFIVRFDSKNEIVYIDTSRMPSVSESDAKELAQTIKSQGDVQGSINGIRYMVRQSPVHAGRTMIFLDTTVEKIMCLQVLLLSLGIGIAGWLLMLALVILLSKRAIKPIAENIEKQKQFVTNAGHEIKTPLAIILSNTEAMELYMGENKWSKNIREQTKRLAGLTQNLLTLAKMDETNSANMSEFSLSDLIRDGINSFNELINSKNISLSMDIQPNVSLKGDREQIRQLISILTDNAVKYTDENGEIYVKLSAKDKKIKFQIKNTCSTLPAVPPDKLFDRFYRADEARTQKSGGYGIGLSVAQSIVTANKGKIYASYEKDNIISFSVEF